MSGSSAGPVLVWAAPCCLAAAVLGDEDDIDIGGRVLQRLLARLGVGHQLLHGGVVVQALLSFP